MTAKLLANEIRTGQLADYDDQKESQKAREATLGLASVSN